VAEVREDDKQSHVYQQQYDGDGHESRHQNDTKMARLALIAPFTEQMSGAIYFVAHGRGNFLGSDACWNVTHPIHIPEVDSAKTSETEFQLGSNRGHW
jgi:hypothetical protein